METIEFRLFAVNHILTDNVLEIFSCWKSCYFLCAIPSSHLDFSELVRNACFLDACFSNIQCTLLVWTYVGHKRVRI